MPGLSRVSKSALHISLSMFNGVRCAPRLTNPLTSKCQFISRTEASVISLHNVASAQVLLLRSKRIPPLFALAGEVDRANALSYRRTFAVRLNNNIDFKQRRVFWTKENNIENLSVN